LLESALEGDITDHLGHDKHAPAGKNSGNSRNGSRAKTALTDVGPVEISVPRDRDGSFEPKIFEKRQKRLTGVDEMVIPLFVKGLTTDEAQVHFAEVSRQTISTINRPLLCAVDDAQWLDQASMRLLGFTARRLRAESVAIVFATRATGGGLPGASEPVGLPELLIEGLPDHEARALLRSVLPGPWDEQVLDRIVAETRGNPLALRELPKSSTLLELADGYGLPNMRSVGGPVNEQIEAAYREMIAGLPLKHADSCLLRRRIRLVNRPCCGARPSNSALASTLHPPPSRRACSRSTIGSPSPIRWPGRRCTGRRPERNGASHTARCRERRT
jgi:hypothetical protein